MVAHRRHRIFAPTHQQRGDAHALQVGVRIGAREHGGLLIALPGAPMLRAIAAIRSTSSARFTCAGCSQRPGNSGISASIPPSRTRAMSPGARRAAQGHLLPRSCPSARDARGAAAAVGDLEGEIAAERETDQGEVRWVLSSNSSTIPPNESWSRKTNPRNRRRSRAPRPAQRTAARRSDARKRRRGKACETCDYGSPAPKLFSSTVQLCQLLAEFGDPLDNPISHKSRPDTSHDCQQSEQIRT